MIRSKFFEDTTGGFASVSSPSRFNRMWKKVLVFEERTGLSLDKGFTREQYVSLFNSMKIRHVNLFVTYKSDLMSYVRYLIANKVLPEEHEAILSSITVNDLSIKSDEGSEVVHYYKNVAMLREAIEDTIKTSESYDETLYDLPSVMLYLAWYGLTEEQILNFPKNAVMEDGIIVNGAKIEIPFGIMQVFKRLRDADGYFQQAKGVIFHKYTDSEYLIRTERKEKITLDNLRTLLYRFNKISDRRYSLRYDVVHQSGIFYRAYILECESTSFDLGDPVFAAKVFCDEFSNRAKHRARVRDYGLYKQLFS